MRRISSFLIAIILAPTLFAQTQLRAPHLFQSEQWNTGAEACLVCHFSDGQFTELNTDYMSNEGQAFKMYGTSTFNGQIGEPNGPSKICLGCHDGTVALEGSLLQSGYNQTGAGNLGDDLSNDHPISFVYDINLSMVDGELANPVTAESGLGNSIDEDLLSQHRLECISCHDVHGQTDIPYLLVKSNTKSKLCLTCHYK